MPNKMKSEESLPEMIDLKLTLDRDAYLQIRSSMMAKHITQGTSSFHEAFVKLIIAAIEEDDDILIITIHGDKETKQEGEDNVEKGKVGTEEMQEVQKSD